MLHPCPTCKTEMKRTKEKCGLHAGKLIWKCPKCGKEGCTTWFRREWESIVAPEEIHEIAEKIERGEVEQFPKGKYLLFDADSKKVVGRYELGENQNLVIMPVIAGG